jgi:hypothetical protein
LEQNPAIRKRIEGAYDVNDPSIQELIPILVEQAAKKGEAYTNTEAEDALDLSIIARRSGSSPSRRFMRISL